MSIVITKEQLENAKAYVPFATKVVFAKLVAQRCTEELAISANRDGEKFVDVPNMYKENTERKTRYMMGALLKLYFEMDFETELDDDMFLITPSDYDKYAELHVLNQIERFKHDSELRDKCYDIIFDYKQLEKLVNSECYGLLNALNDSASRLIATIGLLGTPEEMQKAMAELTSITDELETIKQTKEENETETKVEVEETTGE